MNTNAFWAEIHAARYREFKWGEHDCVTFAMRCAIAYSGRTDIEPRVRELVGVWASEEEARAAIGSGGGLIRAITMVLGERVPWTRLTLGDIAIISDDAKQAVIVVHDGLNLIAPDAFGYRAVPVDRAHCGWKVT